MLGLRQILSLAGLGHPGQPQPQLYRRTCASTTTIIPKLRNGGGVQTPAKGAQLATCAKPSLTIEAIRLKSLTERITALPGDMLAGSVATPTNGNRVLTVTSDSLPMIVDRVQAAEAVEKDTADLQIFTDGSRLEVKDGVGAAAVCKLGRSDGDGSSSWDYRASYIGVAGTYSALQAELFGVIQSLRFVEERIMMRKKGDARLKTVTIFTDCREVERLLRAPIAPREQYLVSFFHNELQRLVECRPRMTVALKWLPGHSGVEGNEVADKRAKEAAKEKRRKGVVAAISVEKQDIIKADAVEA